MIGKRYTTEDKIRILREVDGGKTVQEVCREKNIAEQTFYRWKRTFGMMDVSEARQLKELQKENTELKKMLAESLLKNRVLERYAKKSCEPGPSPSGGATSDSSGPVFPTGRLSPPATGPVNLRLSRSATHHCGTTVKETTA